MDLIEHRVRERAYYIWEDEGCVNGRADAHWLRAEAEIVMVQAVAPEASLAPSPAKVLKPKVARAAKAAVAANAAEVSAKPAAKSAPKAAATAGLAKAKATRTPASAAAVH
ncbi:DUF2934 domain-containing protein [uncultured Methylobacterium sp.]|uniref:DUF2934 domain-containing protein n=1 Tax=uncultured Methylobacterium sp. TaxID=157278 RepID=UPI0035CBE6B2